LSKNVVVFIMMSGERLGPWVSYFTRNDMYMYKGGRSVMRQKLYSYNV